MPGLMPFQAEGAVWLSMRHRALLADEMRVGKTPTSIAACGLVGARTVLVLCPAVARLNWCAEFARFLGWPSGAILSKSDDVHPRITVCSYDIVADKKVYPKIAKPYDVVILDESHYLRSGGSNRTQAAFGIANGARYAWALSGTPTPRDHSDLYPLLYAFGQTLSDYLSFVKRYCTWYDAGMEGLKITGSTRGDELNAMLSGFMLRRTLAEVAPNMPKARWSTFAVQPGPIPKGSMTREELALAGAEERALALRLEEASSLLAELDPDAAVNFRRLVGLQKVRPAVDLIADELASNPSRKLVVFGWHRDVLQALHQALAEFDARLILGSTSDDYKEAAKRDFRESPRCRVIVANIIAAGTAIDLSTADDALFIEEDWLPGNNLQAAMRVVSQFKTRPVSVRTLVLHGTIDARVQAVFQQRMRGTSTIFQNTVAPEAP